MGRGSELGAAMIGDALMRAARSQGRRDVPDRGDVQVVDVDIHTPAYEHWAEV